MTSIYFRDPDRNLIEVAAYRERLRRADRRSITYGDLRPA